MASRLGSLLASLVIQTVCLLESAVASPSLEVTPALIQPALTESLEVNCSFAVDKHADMMGIISLFLSRVDSAAQVSTGLASASNFSAQGLNRLTAEKVEIEGFCNTDRDAYLSLRWDYPIELQAGTYQCSVYGFDHVGRTIVLTEEAEVKATQPSYSELKDKLRDLGLYTKGLEEAVRQYNFHMTQATSSLGSQLKSAEESSAQRMSELDTQLTSLANGSIHTKAEVAQNISSMDAYIKHLEHRLSFLEKFTHLLDYEDYKHYISHESFTNISVSIATCKKYGGNLTEISNRDQYNVFQKALSSFPGLEAVYISGTDEDEEGKWRFSSRDNGEPYIAWGPGEPSGNRGQNCLTMFQETSKEWTTHDLECMDSSPEHDRRYMCELPLKRKRAY